MQETAVFHPGASIAQMRTAKVVRLEPGVTTAQVLQLHNDQMLETKNGRRISVGQYRQLQQLMAAVHSNGAKRHTVRYPIFAGTKAAGTPLKPGETPEQILARPDTDVIRLKTGHSVTAKQMKALVPYVEQTYGVKLHGARPMPNGPATHISKVADLKPLKNAPDSTIVESPKGTRVTLGELRRGFGKTPPHATIPGVSPMQEAK